MRTKAKTVPAASSGAITLLALALAVLCALGASAVGTHNAWADEGALAGAVVDLQAHSVDTQAAEYDISWYEGKSSPYTIANIAQLKGLAYLVNNGLDTFEDKVVNLKKNTQFIFLGTSIDPIGTPEHPFQGTFDGARPTDSASAAELVSATRLQNLTVNAGDRLSYVGLFGYAGNKATIMNLTVTGGDEPLAVTNTKDGKTITRVGAIAGHLGGNIANCWSSVEVSVTNNGAVPSKEGKTAEELCTITYIGGLVGELGGNAVNCKHANADLKVSSTTNVDSNVPYIAGFVGGVIGHQGDESDASFVPTCDSCENTGALVFDVGGGGGVDRFGEQSYSKSSMVGGIVGYCMGNVSNCNNSAEIQTGIVKDSKVQAGWGATTVGGIVGSLRGPVIAESASSTGIVGANETDPGYDVWQKSKGSKAADTIAITQCFNSGNITGLASVAGICGSGGAFTKIEACGNTGLIEGTRWNKPCPAGIVGIMNGDIRYCYNQGRCFSTTGGGYYSAGITALLTTYNTSSTADEMRIPVPELCGCYVTGSIGGESAGYRTGVLTGENDGFIHDNCFLPDLTVDKVKNEAVFGDDKMHSALVVTAENRGTLKNNHELSANQMRTSEAVSYLNKPNARKGDWSLYYVTVPGQYPVLSWQSSGSSTQTDINSVATGVASVESPSYSSAFAPIPTVTLSTRSASTVLYQDADYRVVVDGTAREVGQPYQLTVVGINGYTGELSAKPSYQVKKADIASCTISAAPAVFNWKQQAPSSMTLYDEFGNVVSPGEYTFETMPNADGSTKKVDGKYFDYINSHGEDYRYDVKVTAKDSSEHFEGSTTQAAFRIKWASMMFSTMEVDDPNFVEGAKLGNVVWEGREWDIAKALDTKGYVKIKYTGQEIKPKFKTVTYLGREMRDGTGQKYWDAPLDYDYMYVYGNPNPEDGKDMSSACVDATGSAETSLACVTARFTTGGNFDNYTNVFFEITPASIADDVKIAGAGKTYAYTGKAIMPLTLTYNGMTLHEGKDFTVTSTTNVKPGKASVTLKGKGNYSGAKTVTFTIAKMANPLVVKASAKTLKASKLKKKAQIAALFKIQNAKGAVSVKLVKGKGTAGFKVAPNGKVTVPKGTKKGTYQVKVKVTAKGNGEYQPATKTSTAKLTVK